MAISNVPLFPLVGLDDLWDISLQLLNWLPGVVLLIRIPNLCHLILNAP